MHSIRAGRDVARAVLCTPSMLIEHTYLPRIIAVAATLCSLSLFITSEARAQSVGVVELDLTHNAIDATSDSHGYDGTQPGKGFDFGLGLRTPGTTWISTAELTGGFHDFGGPLDPKASRLMLGSRLGLNWLIRPSVFVHGGVGHVSVDAPPGSSLSRGLDWAGDMGLSLDVSVMPNVELGLEASYNWIGSSDGFQWTQLGAHVTFVMGG
jgi:hypothetical protein